MLANGGSYDSNSTLGSRWSHASCAAWLGATAASIVAGRIFELPVAAEACVAGRVVRRGHIRAGEARERIRQQPSLRRCRDVAAVAAECPRRR